MTATDGLELRLRDADADTWELVGHSTIYRAPYDVSDRLGRYEETIEPGAFRGAVDGTGPVAALRVEHSLQAAPLASTRGGSLSFSDDERGLVLRALLPKNEGDVADAVRKVQRGILTGLSVGMKVHRESWSDDRRRRTIRSADLHEVSLCHLAMNPAASVTGVRADNGQELEVRSLGRLLVAEARSSGEKYSAAELKSMLAKGHALANASGDPSYPIEDADDLRRAISAVGRSSRDPQRVRQHIIKNASRLGLKEMLPDTWNADGSLKPGAARSLVSHAELRRELRGEKPRSTLTRQHRGATERDRVETVWSRARKEFKR